MAFISVVAGTLSVIASFVFNWFLWYYTAIFSAVGIITGFIGTKLPRFKEVSKAGIILSAVGIFLTIVFIIVFNILDNFYQIANV